MKSSGILVSFLEIKNILHIAGFPVFVFFLIAIAVSAFVYDGLHMGVDAPL